MSGPLMTDVAEGCDALPQINTCCVCGTTENLHKDGWYGYRCNSADCVCF